MRRKIGEEVDEGILDDDNDELKDGNNTYHYIIIYI